MPAHNAAGTISGTLSSLRSEADLLQEIIVVDDASSDNTGALALRVAKALSLPVRVIRAECRDAGAARNLGIETASAPWVYFFDADDQHIPGGLRRLLRCSHEMPHAGLIVGSYLRQVDGLDGRIKAPGRYGLAGAENSRDYVTGRIRSIALGSAIVARAAIGDTRFPTGIPYDEDTLFWAKILLGASVATVPQCVLAYAVSTFRADSRFITKPVERFLKWRKKLRDLEHSEIAKSILQLREGMVALKIARVHYARGDFATAARFLEVARVAPKYSRDSWRCLRYRVKISIGRELESLRRLLSRSPAVDAAGVGEVK